MEERQKIYLNFQTQGVQMDHPQTQRTNLIRGRKDKSKQEENTKKEFQSPIWSPILLLD
jgi:hypothetical protein